MKRLTCCIILLAAALWAAPARSQVFSSTFDTLFNSTGASAFGISGAGGGVVVFTNTVPAATSAVSQAAAAAVASAASATPLAASLILNPTISSASYQSVNGVTYSKTATGLLVTASPAALAGSGPLAGHTDGLTIEIPDTAILQLF